MPRADKSQGEPRGVNLDAHPLVNKLHSNPDEIPDIVALTGYLGPSRKDGCVRLYTDLTFRNYYEIPTAGILATAPTNAGDENSPTSVHVSADTTLEAVSISSQSVEARYLQGSISSGHLGSAGPAAQAFTIGFPTQTVINCGPAQTIGCNAAAAGAQMGQPAAQAVGTIPSLLTKINCGAAHTIGCCLGAAAQAGQAANVGTDWTVLCTITCGNTCGPLCSLLVCAGAQAGQPAGQAVGTIPSLLTKINCGIAHTFGCCLGAGEQAGQAGAQAVGTFPTVTQINCGPAQTIGCHPAGGGTQAAHQAALTITITLINCGPAHTVGC